LKRAAIVESAVATEHTGERAGGRGDLGAGTFVQCAVALEENSKLIHEKEGSPARIVL